MRFGAIKQVSRAVTQTSPIRGINAYDGIASMPEGFALVLRNLFAQPYGVQVRHGYVQHVTGLGGEVQTLCSHNLVNGPPKLYAFAWEDPAGELYDVTTPNVPGVLKLAGLSSGWWQHINFPNIAGVHLLAVNGEDDPIWIKPDGTVARLPAGDGTGNTIGGIDPKKLVGIYSHQKRVWFVQKDSTNGWYLPPDQVSGVAHQFDFGPQWVRGGHLVQILTWTIDDGNGADDHLIALSSEGEISVYQGIDPDSLDNWALQGVYYVGAPVGRRAMARYGGDVIILTELGWVMLSQMLKSTKVNPTTENDGRYVQQLISAAVTVNGQRKGWQPFVFPGRNMVMVNIPTGDGASYQYVMNDITKAWSEFIGYNASCWELHDSLPFFGSLGGIYRAWEQFTDDAIVADDGTVTPGADIRSEAQTLYSNFGNPVLNKHYKMVRPTVLSKGNFSISIAANTDYSFQSPQSPVAFEPYVPGKWDEDYWDNARWAGAPISFHEWETVRGIGFTVALRVLMESSSETYWAATDWMFEPGGVM